MSYGDYLMECKLCNTETMYFDTARILKKYDIKYFKCPDCGIIQTEKPYWLQEAYSNAITNSDIGIISRNYKNTEILEKIFSIIFPRKNNFLDYGGGYGIFVRRMRDLGFDFEWFDEYCKNLFAKGHEKSKEHYDVITSFEMFEHLVNPIEECKKMFALADNIVFSTELLPVPNPKITDWWYYCTDHGQHIIFYTKQSLLKIAQTFGKNYYYFGGFHIFSMDKISKFKSMQLKLFLFIYALLNSIIFRNKRSSLLNQDYQSVINKE